MTLNSFESFSNFNHFYHKIIPAIFKFISFPIFSRITNLGLQTKMNKPFIRGFCNNMILINYMVMITLCIYSVIFKNLNALSHHLIFGAVFCWWITRLMCCIEVANFPEDWRSLAMYYRLRILLVNARFMCHSGHQN